VGADNHDPYPSRSDAASALPVVPTRPAGQLRVPRVQELQGRRVRVVRADNLGIEAVERTAILLGLHRHPARRAPQPVHDPAWPMDAIPDPEVPERPTRC